jgi:hypothetical protein
MAVRDAWVIQRLSSVLPISVAESAVCAIGLITLGVKCAGARSAGNQHAACQEAGAGDGMDHGVP